MDPRYDQLPDRELVHWRVAREMLGLPASMQLNQIPVRAWMTRDGLRWKVQDIRGYLKRVARNGGHEEPPSQGPTRGLRVKPTAPRSEP